MLENMQLETMGFTVMDATIVIVVLVLLLTTTTLDKHNQLMGAQNVLDQGFKYKHACNKNIK